MKVSDAFPSKYLKVEDLDDHDLTVTIKETTVEELGQGAEKQKKLIVYFDEVDKGLAANKTNAGIISKLYGDDTDDWIGKQITLWPNHDVEFKGEIVSAIRVRSRAPKAEKPKKVAPAAQNGVDSDAYAALIAESETVKGCDAIKVQVLADTGLDDEEKVALQMAVLQRKKALTAAGVA